MSSRIARPPSRIERIWENPRARLGYPLQAGALGTIALFAALRVIEAAPISMIIILVVHIVLTASFYRYAVEVLLSTAEGKRTAPEFAIAVDDQLAVDQMKLQLLLYVIAVLGQAGWGGDTGLWLFPLIAAVIAPAATLSLAIDRGLLRALNPWVWIQIINAFRGGYFLVVALLFCGFGLRLWLADGFGILPSVLALPLTWLVNNYLTVLGFHLMGYLVYQDHERIGYQLRPDPVLPSRQEREDPDRALIDRALAMADAGQLAAAITSLRATIDQRGGTQALHEAYRGLLSRAGDAEELARHGQQYLLVLMAQRAFPRAVAMLIDCQARDPGFCPSTPEDLLALAEQASQRGQQQAAIGLLENALTRFPKHRLGPSWALLAARLLVDRLGRVEQAQGLLKAACARYPEHPERGELDRYAAKLAELAAKL